MREYSAVSHYVGRPTVRTIDVCDGGRITAIEQSKDKRSFRELARKRVRAQDREGGTRFVSRLVNLAE